LHVSRCEARHHLIAKRVVLRVHEEQLKRHGGDEGILNESRLEAALARPK
jgi:prophage maintenance system killer protein